MCRVQYFTYLKYSTPSTLSEDAIWNNCIDNSKLRIALFKMGKYIQLHTDNLTLTNTIQLNTECQT